MKIKTIDIDESWTLFLDRDGVINHRIIDDYVKNPDEFIFLPGVLEAIARFSNLFSKIIVVTNQQGIGKEVMSHKDLRKVHEKMQSIIESTGGKIDAIYYCPHLAYEDAACRKPNPGMAIEAKRDFPEISFKRSIMVGDSESDIIFGNQLGMKTVYISDTDKEIAHMTLSSLKNLTSRLIKK